MSFIRLIPLLLGRVLPVQLFVMLVAVELLILTHNGFLGVKKAETFEKFAREVGV